MSFVNTKAGLAEELDEIKQSGLWKTERVITSEQKNHISLDDWQ